MYYACLTDSILLRYFTSCTPTDEYFLECFSEYRIEENCLPLGL